MKRIFLLSIPLVFLCFSGSSNCMHRKMARMAYARNNDQSRKSRDKRFFGRTNGRATHSTIKKDEKPSPQSVITTLDLKNVLDFMPITQIQHGCTTCMTCNPSRLATGLLFVLTFAQIGLCQPIDVNGLNKNWSDGLCGEDIPRGCEADPAIHGLCIIEEKPESCFWRFFLGDEMIKKLVLEEGYNCSIHRDGISFQRVYE